MNTSFKIRSLLFLLTLSFIGTALTLRFTFHEEDILAGDGSEIERNLHAEELVATRFLNDDKNFQALKTVQQKGRFIESLYTFRKEQYISVFTFKNHALQFWAANRITPETDLLLKEGSNWVIAQNGYYEAIKRSSGNFSAVCFIPVKARYPLQNSYLINAFSPGLSTSERVDIARFDEENVYNIRSSVDNHFLFALKLKPVQPNERYSTLELYTWLAAFLLCCIFFHSISLWIFSKGHVKASILFLCLFFLAIRAVSLRENWLVSYFNLPLFDAKNYGSGSLYPSFGDLFLNVFSCSWCIIYAYSIRDSLKLTTTAPAWIKACVFALICLFYWIVVGHVDDTLNSLVVNSSISFDVTNILNLNFYSCVGILVLCIGGLNLYLLLLTLLTVVKKLNLDGFSFYLFFGTLISAVAIKLLANDLTLYFFLFLLILYINAWLILKTGEQFNPGIFALTLVLFTCVSSLKLADSLSVKDRQSKKVLAQTLEMSDDPNAVIYFDSLEQRIAEDSVVFNYFNRTDHDYSRLKSRLQKSYFDGYLTRYELTVHAYNPDGYSLDGDSTDNISDFKELVVAGTIKVSNYFYRVNNTFGSRHFFALLPVFQKNVELGTLVVELSSGVFEGPNTFPRVLSDGKIEETEKIQDYSFAFYKNGDLVNQYGRYVYKLRPVDYPTADSLFSFSKRDGFDHLVYRPTPRSLIIVSSAIPTKVTQFGAVSFLFLVLLLFSAISALVGWLWANFILFNPGKITRWAFLTGGGHILYKTRIQVSIVTAVISTLVIVGIVTYFNITHQYVQQQQQAIKDRVVRIADAFEDQMIKNDGVPINDQLFNDFADLNTADLTYFDVKGKLLNTTQPKIYESGLVSSRINALAFLNLHTYRFSEYINEQEQVGQMKYISAYRAIRNSAHKTVGYLGLPSFSNQHELDTRIGEFLNSMVNVYALVLVAIGFFAVFIANQITYPLTLIQKSLGQIKIGISNTPISWKRNDEIGSLIREYNTMIGELEESANRLARSERETAWKEMAKQVAHEIKNPLTPLKLGVQLLDKSWREQDPNFNKKFERFSKSFIEQIESLSHIATEFSNFAKMPETSLENVNIRQLLERSIEVYSKLSHVSISLSDSKTQERLVKGDKDQLLRCFNNLIKNATEAIPEGRQGIIRISIEEQERYAVISLSDNGKGVPDGLKDRIFNPNFTTKSSGTGLGLAFVKQAIENMSGNIRMTTEQQVGTTFYITLPLVSS